MYEGRSNKKPSQEIPDGKKVKKILQEVAEMTPEERAERRKAYLSELKFGQPKMTSEEMEAHKKMRERRKNLEKHP